MTKAAAKMAYLNLGSMLRAAALRGDVAEVARLNAEVNRAWRLATRWCDDDGE